MPKKYMNKTLFDKENYQFILEVFVDLFVLQKNLYNS
jgi:hypothetical protein